MRGQHDSLPALGFTSMRVYHHEGLPARMPRVPARWCFLIGGHSKEGGASMRTLSKKLFKIKHMRFLITNYH